MEEFYLIDGDVDYNNTKEENIFVVGQMETNIEEMIVNKSDFEMDKEIGKPDNSEFSDYFKTQ